MCVAAMSRQGFSGTSSMNFSSRGTGNGCTPPELTEEDKENLQTELGKVEDEIQTLRQVLLAKEKYAADIRRQLGFTPMASLKESLSKGWQDVQTSSPYLTASATLDDISHSSAYLRTKESFTYAGHVTSSALSNVGEAFTRRLAEMRALPLPSPPRRHTISMPAMRSSPSFKSFEDMVGNVKGKMSGTKAANGDPSGYAQRVARQCP
ncbi:tumor protein D54-like [Periophthalmus magnuspinnatus]|uniref:tumor protein D54-like n=1 Tax=Periophthalmus magnuspinnatus TaxID=409849 RepID=UPI0024363900|nr:tumor protein D54-like [Periophthalmus magnuspinnatus]